MRRPYMYVALSSHHELALTRAALTYPRTCASSQYSYPTLHGRTARRSIFRAAISILSRLDLDTAGIKISGLSRPDRRADKNAAAGANCDERADALVTTVRHQRKRCWLRLHRGYLIWDRDHLKAPIADVRQLNEATLRHCRLRRSCARKCNQPRKSFAGKTSTTLCCLTPEETRKNDNNEVKRRVAT
ncbi:unnamed protein product, partial [Trichogramma brassicae]